MNAAFAAALFLLISPTAAETIVHHGIVGHWENVGACPEHLTTPKCEPGGKYCDFLGMCTKPDGKCSVERKGCVDIRWNRDVCVPPANACNSGFCGRFLLDWKDFVMRTYY